MGYFVHLTGREDRKNYCDAIKSIQYLLELHPEKFCVKIIIIILGFGDSQLDPRIDTWSHDNLDNLTYCPIEKGFHRISGSAGYPAQTKHNCSLLNDFFSNWGIETKKYVCCNPLCKNLCYTDFCLSLVKGFPKSI